MDHADSPKRIRNCFRFRFPPFLFRDIFVTYFMRTSDERSAECLADCCMLG